MDDFLVCTLFYISEISIVSFMAVRKILIIWKLRKGESVLGTEVETQFL